jgi:hypothetical protein
MADEANTQNTDTGDGGDGGNTQTSGLTQIPENIRGHEAFAGYKAMSDLWQGHIDLSTKTKDLESKLADSIPKLGENATDEQKAAYRAAMGIPEKADDYNIPLIEGMDNSLAPWFKEKAFARGIPKDIAEGLAADYNELLTKTLQELDEQRLKNHNEAIDKLKNEWGDNANANAETIKIAYQHIVQGVPALDSLLKTEIDVGGGKKALLGDLPAMQELSLWIGKKMLPDTALPGNPPGGEKAKVGMNYDK